MKFIDEIQEAKKEKIRTIDYISKISSFDRLAFLHFSHKCMAVH